MQAGDWRESKHCGEISNLGGDPQRQMATRRMSEHYGAPGIATEPPDIVAHPFERRDQVEHAGIAGMGIALAAKMGEVQMAEDVEAVVDGDHDDIAAPRQVGAVGDRAVRRAEVKRAAMQPHHDRPLGAVPQAATPDVQGQAILRFRRRIRWTEKRFEFRTALRSVG